MGTNRIGLIIGTLPARYRGIAAGGIATHINGLIGALNKEGIQTFICYHKPFGVHNEAVINSTKIGWILSVVKGLCILIGKRNYSWKSYSFKTHVIIAYYISTLKHFFKSNNIDFIHVHSLYNPAPIALELLHVNKRIIVTDHGFWVDPLYTKRKKIRLLRTNFTLAQQVIYISNIALSYHQAAQLGDLRKLVKIPNPTSFEYFPQKISLNLYDSNVKKNIIFNGFGGSLKIKGLPFLLKAVNENDYLSRNTRLLIICNNEAKKYIQNHEWNFEYQVFGCTSFEKILEMYTQSDLLVVPSKFESFGLVYTEALAIGIPVIGYYAMIDEFRKVLNRYIGESIDITKEQPSDLARKIIGCLDTAMDQEGVRRALIKHYDWVNLINYFLIMYYGA